MGDALDYGDPVRVTGGKPRIVSAGPVRWRIGGEIAYSRRLRVDGVPILASVSRKPDLSYSCFMIRLPILKDELAFLEKLLPDLEARPDLGHLAVEIKKRIDKIRQEIRVLQENK